MTDRPARANRPERPAPTDGLAIVDKAAGLTSHDVVARFRRIAGTRRVGHAGTLDPMATGVLVIAVGRATRLLSHIDLDAKGYSARIRLGQSTNTDDAEGELLAAVSAAHITPEQVVQALAAFTGPIMQVPASVSAIKVNGERAYKRVRDGESFELAARPVTVSRFDALSFTAVDDVLDVDVEVDCTAGTYIRALARDLGRSLGVGGHLTQLRRTRVGPFTLDQARTLEELSALADPVAIPMTAAVRAALPVREVDPDEVRELSFGRALSPSGRGDDVYAAIGPDDSVVALLRDQDGRGRPVVVFSADQN
jgi:tRNA pseudouridine55 synthase